MYAKPMFARRNDYGVSVNESSICSTCITDDIGLDDSLSHWEAAQDVTSPDTQDNGLYPIDNPDGLCNGCGASTGIPL